MVILEAYIESEGGPEGRGTPGGGVILLHTTKFRRAIVNMGWYCKFLLWKPWTLHEARYFVFEIAAWEVELTIEDDVVRLGLVDINGAAFNVDMHNDISWLSVLLFGINVAVARNRSLDWSELANTVWNIFMSKFCDWRRKMGWQWSSWRVLCVLIDINEDIAYDSRVIEVELPHAVCLWSMV